MFNLIEDARNEGQVIGFTASAFDVLHAGHIAMLAEAKQNCDFLIVGLLTDPTINRRDKNKPVQSTLERYIQADAVSYIDMVIPFDTEEDLVDLLLLTRPDIRFVGEEYEGTEHTGDHLDTPIHYNKRDHSFSTRELRERIYEAELDRRKK